MLLVAIRTALYIRPLGDELLTLSGVSIWRQGRMIFAVESFFSSSSSISFLSAFSYVFCFPSRQIADNRLLWSLTLFCQFTIESCAADGITSTIYVEGDITISPCLDFDLFWYILNRHFRLIPLFVAAILNAPTLQWMLYRQSYCLWEYDLTAR